MYPQRLKRKAGDAAIFDPLVGVFHCSETAGNTL